MSAGLDTRVNQRGEEERVEVGATTDGHSQLRVGLLRGDDHHNRYLDALLRSRFDVVTTVEEPGRAQRKALRRREKWRDALAAEYHHARRRVLGLNRYRARYFADALRTAGLAPPPPPTLTVASINDRRVAEIVADAQPDVIVITCTTILSAASLRALDRPILNIHGGHLPDYRGCHCFFFALYEENYDKIGSTIHFVDTGIDTGDIVEVVRPAIHRSDNAEKLYSRAERLAAHRLCDWLSVLENGGEIPRAPQAFVGRLCLRRHRLPHHDLLFALRRMLGRLQLPEVQEFAQWRR